MAQEQIKKEHIWFFTEESQLQLFDGSYKKISSLQKGDVLIGEKDSKKCENIVKSIIKFYTFYGEVVHFPRFSISKSTPVCNNNFSSHKQWTHASMYFPAGTYYGNAYIVITEKNMNLILDDYEIGVVANLQKGEIIGHPYLSTNQILKDLENFQENEDGTIIIDEINIKFSILPTYNTYLMISGINKA